MSAEPHPDEGDRIVLNPRFATVDHADGIQATHVPAGPWKLHVRPADGMWELALVSPAGIDGGRVLSGHGPAAVLDAARQWRVSAVTLVMDTTGRIGPLSISAAEAGTSSHRQTFGAFPVFTRHDARRPAAPGRQTPPGQTPQVNRPRR